MKYGNWIRLRINSLGTRVFVGGKWRLCEPKEAAKMLNNVTSHYAK